MSVGVLLYDGDCNLCNSSIAFIKRHSPPGLYRYIQYQEPEATELIQTYPALPSDMSSVALIEAEQVYLRSTAICRVARRFYCPWKALAAGQLVPECVRDRVYNWVGRNRYRWFGKVK
jgi:predicted DCC family thiol-disulfide oxidoreductase YuxK